MHPRASAPLGRCKKFELLTRHLGPRPPRHGMIPGSYALYHDAQCKVQPVPTTHGRIDVGFFRSLAWEPAVPLHLQNYHHLPAMKNWFTNNNEYSTSGVSFGEKLYLKPFARTLVSYELMVESPRDDISWGHLSKSLRDFQTWLRSLPAEEDNHFLCELVEYIIQSVKSEESRFIPFEAPLNLIIRASQFNESRDDPMSRIKQLYIAQSDIRSLPESLVTDLPVPDIVTNAGKGDVYSSSIWLGLQPTYTPLHRDPNPNLFCQLVGSKSVRLLRPKDGLSVFQDVRRRLGTAGNSRFRGPEMMEGPERDGLHSATWETPDMSKDIWEAQVNSGDALFIPRGWWHSVMSAGNQGTLNASANWWFR